jgi:protein-S-isoprenylcysteine O-methyltransferase Ste14
LGVHEQSASVRADLWLYIPLYYLDHQNSTAALASWLGSRLQSDPDLVARILFAFAAILLTVAVLLRTWASSYLRAGVVYAAEVKTDSLIADGPYRLVRNPLYFANVLMVIGMGAMMSRTAFLVAALEALEGGRRRQPRSIGQNLGDKND